jgi:hypothetical protein
MTAKEEKLQFVRAMIVKLRTFLLTTDELISMSIDGGGAVSYDRKGAWERLKELELEERNLVNPNRWVRSIDLSQAF